MIPYTFFFLGGIFEDGFNPKWYTLWMNQNLFFFLFQYIIEDVY